MTDQEYEDMVIDLYRINADQVTPWMLQLRYYMAFLKKLLDLMKNQGASSVNVFNFIAIGPQGDDLTGTRGNLAAPFATLAAAKLVYQEGDVITFNAGTYLNQEKLDIAGMHVFYHMPAGVIVEFSNEIIGATTGLVTLRGSATLTAVNYLSSSSAAIIDLEFASLTLSGKLQVTNGFHRWKGKSLSLSLVTSEFYLQGTSSGEVEITTITQSGLNTNAGYTNINDIVDWKFFNTTFVWAEMLLIHSATEPAARFSNLEFHDCRIVSKSFGTQGGFGTINCWHGRVILDNTTIESAENGITFRKLSAEAEFWFDKVRITSGEGFYSMDANFTGNFQCRPPNIRILGGGLVIDKDVSVDVTRPITNLQPGTYAVREDYVGSAPAPSRFSGIYVIDEPT